MVPGVAVHPSGDGGPWACATRRPPRESRCRRPRPPAGATPLGLVRVRGHPAVPVQQLGPARHDQSDLGATEWLPYADTVGRPDLSGAAAGSGGVLDPGAGRDGWGVPRAVLLPRLHA